MLAMFKLSDDRTIMAKGIADATRRKAGEITDDGLNVCEVPEADFQAAVIGHTKLINGRLVADANYEPVQPVSNPSADDLIHAELAKQVANLTVSNASLAKQVATLVAAKNNEAKA